MTIRLNIGIVGREPGVRILLGQLGLAHEVIAGWASLDPSIYSVIIVNAPLDHEQTERIDDYLKRGGAVLDTGYFLPRIRPGSFGRKKVSYLLADREDEIFGDIWLADIDATLRLYSDARHLGGIAALESYGDGAIAYIPLDTREIFTSEGAERKQFYSPFTSDPNEIVAAVSKGEIRKIFERALHWLHDHRAIPYLHLRYVPGDLENIFCYRIDSDYGTRDQVEALYDVARSNDIAMTWFLHVGAHHDWLDIFRKFEGQEFGVHCFRHRTFRSLEDNSANISEAAHLLREHAIDFTGYAAPNGFWNHGVARAAGNFGFEYSSEFSLDYDDLPFFPWLLGESSKTLQVPVHPVCIGSFLRVKASDEGMKRYFRWIIDRKMEEQEPVLLYHHPGHEHWGVMDDTFRYAKERGLKNMTMGEYARWWIGRSRTRYDAWFADGVVSVRFHDEPRSVKLSLRDPGGARTFIGAGETRLDEVAWRPRTERRIEVPADIARIRKFNPLLLRHSIEDYNARARQ